MLNPTRVVVVLCRAFGAQLDRVPLGQPAWVINSPDNDPTMSRRWDVMRAAGLAPLSTLFTAETDDPEVAFLQQVADIDLHHGPNSLDPPYSEIEVFGCECTLAV